LDYLERGQILLLIEDINYKVHTKPRDISLCIQKKIIKGEKYVPCRYTTYTQIVF